MTNGTYIFLMPLAKTRLQYKNQLKIIIRSVLRERKKSVTSAWALTLSNCNVKIYLFLLKYTDGNVLSYQGLIIKHRADQWNKQRFINGLKDSRYRNFLRSTYFEKWDPSAEDQLSVFISLPTPFPFQTWFWKWATVCCSSLLFTKWTETCLPNRKPLWGILM